MATEFSDIYLNGTNFEELHAGGGQIVEAWLNGECIWRLVDKLKYWIQIYSWTRHKGISYGSGIHATSDSANPKYEKVFFSGADVSSMLFFATESYLPWGRFPDGEIISAYDFGFCVFSTYFAESRIHKIEVRSTGTLNAKKFPEDLGMVNKFLDDTLVNISYPLGESCNVFSNKYHVYSSTRAINLGSRYITVGVAVIENVLNSTIKEFVLDLPIQGNYYALGACAYYKDKIYFLGENTTSKTFDEEFCPIFYINREKNELEHVEIPLPYPVSTIRPGGIDANDSRLIWVYTLSGKSGNGLFLYEYDGNTVKYSLMTDQFLTSGAKIIGEYIVLFGSHKVRHNSKLIQYKIYAGKKIHNMHSFDFNAYDYGLNYGSNTTNKCDATPRVFYEENNELYFDIIYTQGKGALSGYNGSSFALKMKFNFSIDKIEEVSRTELNGSWEE